MSKLALYTKLLVTKRNSPPAKAGDIFLKLYSQYIATCQQIQDN